MKEYVVNNETGKLEMRFTKEEYMALSEENKKTIKSNFLFSRKQDAWVSRCKFPNLHYVEQIAQKLGFTNGGKVGEMLSFREQMEQKAERAEARADRYDNRSDKAIERGKQLQKPINDMHGDISFFTQPNINTSAGRAFTNRRNRMFAAYERGFEEFKKSEYYADRAEAARATAATTKPTDKAFCERRIRDAEKTIKAQKKNLESYNKTREKIENGKEVKRWNGDIVTLDEVNRWIENAEQIIENAISKSIYYHECLDELGGVQFSKENIKPGHIVNMKRWGRVLVIGTGPKNFKYQIMDGGAAGLGGSDLYAEIIEIVSDEINLKKHPFKEGERFTVNEWDSGLHKYIDKEYRITKTTDERVTLKSGIERAINRKPRMIRNGKNKMEWALDISNGPNGTIYKVSED